MAKTLKSYIRSFIACWTSSVASRLRGAKVYADAVNSSDLNAKYEFQSLEGFEKWTPQMWNLLYQIGSGILSPRFLEVKAPSIPLCLGRHSVPISRQEQILGNPESEDEAEKLGGLDVARINGTTRRVAYKALKVCQINQVFKNDGTERTVAEQVAWLREHNRPNAAVLEDGTIRVYHNCTIRPEQLYQILTHQPFPLSSSALMAAATVVAKAGH